MADKPKDQKEIRRSPAPGKVRRISADGFRWIVQEVSAPAFDRRGGTHLMFDGESIMRRVREFPANWMELSDEELYALSQRVKPS